MQGNINETHTPPPYLSETPDDYKLITKASDYVIISDHKDRITWVNEGFTKITGYKLTDVVGLSPAVLLRGSKTDMPSQHRIDDASKKRQPFRDQILNYTKSGELVWLSLNVTPIHDDNGNFQKYVTIGSDISYLKKAEEDLKIKSFRLKLLNEISYELISTNSYEGTFHIAMTLLQRNFPEYVRTSASLFNFESGLAEFFAVNFDQKSHLSEGKTIPLKEISSISTLKQSRFNLVNDISSIVNPSSTDQILMKEGIRSYLIVPLLFQGSLLGSLNIGAKNKNAFPEINITTFTEIAQLLAISINQTKLKVENERVHQQIKAQNSAITDSLQYAHNIQRAILPESRKFRKHFSDFFIFHKPRDIVSGDFYWLAERDNKVFFTAADCTGHGVPGAFMSMIGSSLLDQIVLNKKTHTPNQILNHLRKGIIKSLKQKGISGEQRDGMDAAFCVFDKTQNTLEYAGARNSLVVIRKKTETPLTLFENEAPLETLMESQSHRLYELKADRQPVALFHRELNPFTNHKITLKPGDSVYLYSDGYPDQFGGKKGAKYLMPRFRKLLLDMQPSTMKVQKQHLNHTLNLWKQNHPQNDDILVMGIRFG